MMLSRLRLVAASAILAVQLGGAVAADTIKLAVLGPMSGPFALQGEERLKVFQASADIVKAGQPGVKYDEEKSGYGWKTEAFIDAKDTVPPVRCQMERPSM